MATEKRLIDATPIIDECKECSAIEWNKSVYTTWAEAEEDFMQRLLDAPTVDAVEVVHGRFEFACVHNGKKHYKCTNCHHAFPFANVNYCPNCGAMMDGGGSNGI